LSQLLEHVLLAEGYEFGATKHRDPLAQRADKRGSLGLHGG
jgi:hypothetical protein